MCQAWHDLDFTIRCIKIINIPKEYIYWKVVFSYVNTTTSLKWYQMYTTLCKELLPSSCIKKHVFWSQHITVIRIPKDFRLKLTLSVLIDSKLVWRTGWLTMCFIIVLKNFYTTCNIWNCVENYIYLLLSYVFLVIEIVNYIFYLNFK